MNTYGLRTNKIFANGIEEVRNMNFPLDSDNIVLDYNEPILYDIHIDTTGRRTIDIYDTIKREPKDEIKELKNEISALKEELLKLRGGSNESSGE